MQYFKVNALIFSSLFYALSLLAQGQNAPPANQRNANLPPDWDYKENWRSNREAYFRGETESQAIRNELPYGPGGIGYDADPGYLRIESEADQAARDRISENNRTDKRRDQSNGRDQTERQQRRMQQNR